MHHLKPCHHRLERRYEKRIEPGVSSSCVVYICHRPRKQVSSRHCSASNAPLSSLILETETRSACPCRRSIHDCSHLGTSHATQLCRITTCQSHMTKLPKTAASDCKIISGYSMSDWLLEGYEWCLKFKAIDAIEIESPVRTFATCQPHALMSDFII